MSSLGSQGEALRAGAQAEAQRLNVQVQASHFNQVWREPPLVIPDEFARDPRVPLLGPLGGRRVLDLGCGRGEWSVFLAQRGALVVGADVSLAGVQATGTGAAFHQVGARVRGLVADAHALPFADGSFDVIHGQFILHHLDLARAGPELARVLRPGGVAAFVENSANNPLLMLVRPLCGRFGIPKWSVEGEYPLRRSDVRQLAGRFGEVENHFFEFRFFRLADEKLFGGRCVLGWLDPWIYRHVPWLRPYGYTQWLVFRRTARARPIEIRPRQ